MASEFSRRKLFTFLARARKDGEETHPGTDATPEPPPVPTGPKLAIIQGRHCTAPDDYCALCVERCPEPGAMTAHDIIPMVVAELCTGCGVCQQVCPAPTNAVLLIPKPQPPGSGLVSSGN